MLVPVTSPLRIGKECLQRSLSSRRYSTASTPPRIYNPAPCRPRTIDAGEARPDAVLPGTVLWHAAHSTENIDLPAAGILRGGRAGHNAAPEHMLRPVAANPIKLSYCSSFFLVFGRILAERRQNIPQAPGHTRKHLGGPQHPRPARCRQPCAFRPCIDAASMCRLISAMAVAAAVQRPDHHSNRMAGFRHMGFTPEHPSARIKRIIAAGTTRIIKKAKLARSQAATRERAGTMCAGTIAGWRWLSCRLHHAGHADAGAGYHHRQCGIALYAGLDVGQPG